MSGSNADFLWLLLRASGFLCVAFITVWYALRWSGARSIRIQRVAWSLVLLQGLLIAPFSVQLPWLESNEQQSTASIWLGKTGHTHAPLLGSDANDVELGPEGLSTEDAERVSVASLPVANFEPGQFVAARDRSSLPSPASILVLGWFAGMLACVSVWAWRYRSLLQSLQSSELANPEWHSEWDMLRAPQTSTSVPLRVHETLGPMICLTPSGHQVVVPKPLWTSLSAAERRAVLQHELAHYLRGDIWKSLMARLIALPHWFNPVAWFAVRRFDEVAEWACDETLAKTDPKQVPSYARVLLRLVELESPQLGMSAAGGASLAERIRRLVVTPAKETRIGRAGFCLVLACLLIGGIMRFEFVESSAFAQNQERNDFVAEGEDPDEVFRRELLEFASQIDPNGDESVGQLKEKLATETGQLVALDRIGWVEERLRDEARDKAIPEFMNRYFGSDGSVRDAEFAKRYVETCKNYNKDIEAIANALQKIAAGVVGDDEADLLLKRFLRHDAAAPMLYFRQLRAQLRPGVDEIQQRLDEVFVRIGDGFHVRSGSLEEAEKVASTVETAMKARELIKDELVEFSTELADKEGRTKRLKNALRSPAFHAIAAYRMAENFEGSLTGRMDELFEQLEWLTIDAADGLVVNEQESEHLDELLEQAERTVVAAKKLRQPVAAFAERVIEKDDLHRKLKRFLQSELAPMLIAQDYEVSSATPETAVHAMLSEGLEMGDDAVKLREEVRGEFTELAREVLREYRTLKRKARPLDRFAEKVKDPVLATVLKSDAGKLVIADAIKSDYASRRFDGLRVWVDEHFENTPSGYVFKGDYEPEVQDFLEQINQVEQELANNDF